jgi:hypothetical protein
MFPRKIISSGTDGADRAALDVAIKLGIPYGGWMSGDMKGENNIPENKYKLKKMMPSEHPGHIENNVIDSDGTLIFSHGKLDAKSIWQDGFAEKHQKPWLHIDLYRITGFEASIKISEWVLENHVEILNVTGSRSKSDQNIYAATMNVLESAIFLGQIDEDLAVDISVPYIEEKHPQTVTEAVDLIVSGLPLKDRVLIANMTAAELESLDNTLGSYIRKSFGIWTGNENLIASCRFESGNRQMHEEGSVMVIINKLWDELRKTHKLKRIK